MEQILHRLSKAVRSAIDGTQVQRKFIPHALDDLTKLETHPACLTEIAYERCSMICENRQSLEDWEGLLLVSLEIGFRHLDPQTLYISSTLNHTIHHLEMVDVVFKRQKSEEIADLLHAWTIEDSSLQVAHMSLRTCTEHLVGLHNIVPFSSRLRRLVIHSVELIGYKGFKRVGVERFVELLNHLRVTVEDMDYQTKWGELLLETLQTSEGAQHLSHWYWELLVELVILWPLQDKFAYSPQIVTFLVGAQEWNKLECWMATIWMIWPPEVGGITEEDLDRSIFLLFQQRPGAFQKLEQWVERWSQEAGEDAPESFQRTCRQAHEAARWGAS
jgi:hypothetical protein